LPCESWSTSTIAPLELFTMMHVLLAVADDAAPFD
jgi:hypothetical protein